MKKTFYLGSLLFSTLTLSSCGGNEITSSLEIMVKPKTTSLKGDLKDYFDVVDKDYLIKIDDESLFKTGILTVEVKRNNKEFDFETDNINPFGTNGSEDYHVGFGIEIFDESGPKFISNPTSGGVLGPYSSDDVIGLMKLNAGETGFIRWSLEEKEMKGLIDFQLSSALEEEDNEPIQKTSTRTDAFNEADKILNKAHEMHEKNMEKASEIVDKAFEDAKNMYK